MVQHFLQITLIRYIWESLTLTWDLWELLTLIWNQIELRFSAMNYCHERLRFIEIHNSMVLRPHHNMREWDRALDTVTNPTWVWRQHLTFCHNIPNRLGQEFGSELCNWRRTIQTTLHNAMAPIHAPTNTTWIQMRYWPATKVEGSHTRKHAQAWH